MIKPVRLVDEARDELLAEGVKYGMGLPERCAQRSGWSPGSPRGAAYPKRRGVRRYVMKRYPFVVVYRELAKEIRVLAVAATKRRPGYWHRRG